jgi:hypothetical protein
MGYATPLEEVLALRSEVVRLREALAPFVAPRDQSPSQMAKVIHKDLNDMTPIALVVTKGQFIAASALLHEGREP